MASTRSPTPASREGTPELESPTAKIRALLATVDSSDDENTNTNTNSTSGNKKKNSASATLASHRSLFGNPEAASTSRGLSDDDDDDGEEEVVVARPRGRLAARMHAALNQGGDNANQVLERETKTAADEDDDATPTAPRRLQRKSATETAVEDEDTPARSTSPGLFVSPSKPSPSKSTHNDESGSDADLPDLKTNRFKALVERKRKERLEREAAQEAKRAERLAQQEKLASDLPDLGSDDGDAAAGITDDEGGRKLTQEARPTRKASKKAIEEMNRETQRMARSMQLAHEAKTRKKISKSSLFERFNFKPAGGAAAAPEPKTASSSRPATPPSDVEMKDTEEPEDTPPSSPPTGKQQQQKQQEQQEPAAPITIGDVGQPAADQDDDLPDMNIQLSSQPREDKGKGKAVEVSEPVAKPKKQVRVRLPQPSVNVTLVDSDDELQITTTSKDKLKALFDSIPSKKPNQVKSLQALKALAQVRSPGKEGRRRGEKPGMNVGQLHMSLHQKARQQAKIERQRRLDALKAQGVVVETAEERERQMQEVEDIVAKARAEAEQIRDAEREKSKNGKGEEKEHDPLAWDDSDDEEYQASDDGADAELSAVELSGSEDEDVEVGEDPGDPMFDEAADEGESEKEASDHEMADEDEDEDEEQVAVAPKRRSRKNVTVISDDEAELSVEATPKPKSKTHTSPQAPDTKTTTPGSVLRSAKKTFIPGLPVSGPAGLSLTQIFAGTMDDSQVSPSGPVPTQSMMPDFDALPNSNFSATPDEPEVSLPSQKGETQGETQGIQLNYSQSQMHGLDTLLRDDIPATQYSEVIEASQDGGFQEHTPIKDRFSDPPFSTVDTLVLDKDGQESPLIRRGRLRQKRAMTPVAEDIPPTASLPGAPATPSAFQAMKEAAREKKRRQAQADFDKKKSKAKEMVEEQADESEDEYAGLGGADGEDSDNESTASLKDMVDDAANNDGDERKLAAFYADRERANDEKAVEQLFKDITNGNLRRKRGADYDLSDSDDGGEALRRRKRQQFAKMQTALFKDERVKKMAENPGNQAFLRTIEDRGSDDEMDYLNVVEEPSQKESQSQENEQQQQQQVVPDSQPARSGPSGAVQNRAPAHLRRTKGGNKPSNIGEVRETLSNLLEDREGSFIPATVAGSDSEGGEDEEDEGDAPSARSDKENQAPNARRTHTVVDRISLKRNPSAASNSSRLAFTANEAGGTFKVPALLRRATTNSFKSTGSSASSSAGPSSTPGVTTSAGGASGSGFGDEAKIKRAAGKRSGVHAFARENERKAKMVENERRRQEKKVQGAKGRAGMVGGLLGKGTFE